MDEVKSVTVNERTKKIVNEIAEILERENCTVDEARDILLFIVKISGKKSTVQLKDVIQEYLK